MEYISNSDYVASIKQSVSIISTELDRKVADTVFECYGARSVDDLNPAYLTEVFSKFFAIEADLR